ncbi:MAG: 3-dehydroquinate synthase [bacterium]|nr:3-dehydroquinate synthase [bacterium]
MKIVKVFLGDRSYSIYIKADILREAGKYIKELNLSNRVLIITNPTVGGYYLNELIKYLKEYDLIPCIAEVPDGEEYKSLEYASYLYDKMISFKLDRNTPVIAFGGGVIGDLAGFVTATFMRGLPLIQIPTTLLSQVDSSVGGKVAVNHPKSKNMIGSFYQPKMVLIDVNLLRTLPGRELKSGLSEVIKYGVIKDKSLFDYLKENISKIKELNRECLEEIIARSCKIKADIVSRDEREAGVRAILNYGHTVGHALESITKYDKYRHGEAIAVGMIVESNMAVEMNLFDKNGVVEQEDLFKETGLKINFRNIEVGSIIKAMWLDKKVLEEKLRFVLPVEIGSVIIKECIDEEIIKKAIKMQEEKDD